MTDLNERAAALLAAADKMTPGEWRVRWHTERCNDGDATVETDTDHPIGIMYEASITNTVADFDGIALLHNEAPALIRELLAENERLRAENVKDRAYLIEQERGLRARVAELESPTPTDEAKDAGPSPFQGRTTRRDEDDDKEYNFMMSHYEGRN